MDQFRNGLIIATTITTLFVTLIWFFFNGSLALIKREFKFKLSDYSKSESVVFIVVVLTYAILILNVILTIFSKRMTFNSNSKIDKEEMVCSIIYILLMFLVSWSYNSFKSCIDKRIKEKVKNRNMKVYIISGFTCIISVYGIMYILSIVNEPDKIDSNKLVGYFMYLIIYFVLLVFSSGVISNNHRINNLREYIIRHSNSTTIGEIIFEVDEFYIVNTDQDLIYLSRKEIKSMTILPKREKELTKTQKKIRAFILKIRFLLNKIKFLVHKKN